MFLQGCKHDQGSSGSHSRTLKSQAQAQAFIRPCLERGSGMCGHLTRALYSILTIVRCTPACDFSF